MLRSPGWAVLLAVCLLLTACRGLGAPRGYEVQARFPRTFNLFPGSPVEILGLNSGVVETLDVDEGSDTVVATMVIRPDVTLPADVRAVVLTDALLGERYVQLTPAYTRGPTFEAGSMIAQPATVPPEFDDLLNALDDFVVGIQGGDVARLVDNLAAVLDGNGQRLGTTLDATRDALGVLQDYDQDIVSLASRLADVTETLDTRRTQLGTLVEDFATLSQVLADQRGPIDQSLSSLARLADETGRLLDTNRTLLEDDVATVTRVGQTAVRNLDAVSSALLNAAELFRGTERAVDRQRNWLPLVNNTDDLVNFALQTVQDRVGALCQRRGLPTDVCTQLTDAIDGIVPDQICLPPLLACAPDGPAPLGKVLGDALSSTVRGLDGPSAGDAQQLVDGLVDNLTQGLGEVANGLGLGGGG